MTIQLDPGHLVTLFVAFCGCLGVFGKVLLAQANRGLDQRFAALDEARAQGQAALAETLRKLESQGVENARTVSSLERDFLNWKGKLPLHYVRREDYMRGQSVLEAKQDALYSKLEVVAVQLAQLEKGGHP